VISGSCLVEVKNMIHEIQESTRNIATQGSRFQTR
jgi:hypothetical protein